MNNSFSSKDLKIEWEEFENLKLDIQNPRIASITNNETLTSDELVKLLWTEMAVAEIALSIAVNGYFSGEPLFVIPDEETGKYIVVEGNRRLAAVRILLKDDLRQKIKATELDENISEEALQTLMLLPVVKYNTREELWKYLGLRHINGAKPWDAVSKAQYIAQVHDEYSVPLDQIAKMIGDQHSTVKRLYRGFEILIQAEQQTSFSREDRFRNKFYFSHLYTAVDQPQFLDFLGVNRDESLIENPVPDSKLSQLEELLTWLYGNKEKGLEPIVKRQNPDLNILREIIGKQESLTVFRTLAARGSPFALARSHEIAIGDEQRFSDALIEAKEKLQQASATVNTGYHGSEELFQIIEAINSTAQGLRRSMKPPREKAILN
ncbi:hypothetical protein MNBD_CHLOROFLEXI01-112 [hydrothermal vent metagenome]|uniref:Uncharacterized protein n=1 Tax=hydrothermal vent metagenome TaxID=652676 RepID=A0A3B0VJ24_9ZZZZ